MTRHLVLLVAVLAPLLSPSRTEAAPADQACQIATAPAFGFADATTLGCATGEAFTTGAADQAFEHGRMLWLEEWMSIVVMSEGSSYTAYDDLYTPDQPESLGLDPPDPALLEPRAGFGKVWRTLGGADAPIGWATAPEERYPATVQYFEHGAAIQRADGSSYILDILNHERGQWAQLVQEPGQ